MLEICNSHKVFLPFFINTENSFSRRYQREASLVGHKIRPLGINRIEVSGESEELSAWLDPVVLP